MSRPWSVARADFFAARWAVGSASAARFCARRARHPRMSSMDPGQARSDRANTLRGMIAAMPLLFSYGTLRDPAVQRANFGRELSGREDELPGYRLELLEISDPHVLDLSGLARHPIVVDSGDPRDRVPGMVFEVTDEELAAADQYEVDDYERVLTTLGSGDAAWVYVRRA